MRLEHASRGRNGRVVRGGGVRILYLEDEADIAEGVVEILRLDRYDVRWAQTLADAYEAAADAPCDLALLDVMVAGDHGAGFRFAHDLREVGFRGHVLFVTARAAVSDRVHGLDIGGDDYLIKPFSLEELRARVRALLRRGSQLKQAKLVRGSLAVDLAARKVELGGDAIDLSDREFAMLELFVHEPDRTFRTEELLDRLFPTAISGATVVRVYVSNLRKKLGDSVVETVASGYRLGSG
jgi:DNA-binding response OmpR family regulator